MKSNEDMVKSPTGFKIANPATRFERQNKEMKHVVIKNILGEHPWSRDRPYKDYSYFLIIMAAIIPSVQETPFKIQISDESIQLLKQKLELTRFPDELEDAGRDYGVPLADIQRLVARWRDGYDWRQHERQLNEDLPQFKRDIQVDGFGTLGIHYIHKKSEVSDAIPLLFVHGCK